MYTGMTAFELVAPFQMTGDQPQAVEKLLEGLRKGYKHQTLLGVTGSGKTFTMANVIARWGRPTLVISPNKTLAAQLYAEFREVFPHNAVEYFVSYYDYYQPEAYIPAPIPTSPRTPTSTRRSTSCAMPPPGRSSPAATSSSSPPCRASTAWASPASTTSSSYV